MSRLKHSASGSFCLECGAPGTRGSAGSGSGSASVMAQEFRALDRGGALEAWSPTVGSELKEDLCPFLCPPGLLLVFPE